MKIGREVFINWAHIIPCGIPSPAYYPTLMSHPVATRAALMYFPPFPITWPRNFLGIVTATATNGVIPVPVPLLLLRCSEGMPMRLPPPPKRPSGGDDDTICMPGEVDCPSMAAATAEALAAGGSGSIGEAP